MMKEKKMKIIIFLSALVLIAGDVFSASSLTFDEAYSYDRFNSHSLSQVLYLRPAEDGWFDDQDRRNDFLSSTGLVNLCSLDLRRQDIDDNFIVQLSQNPTFSRINSIDLSGNAGITDLSLAHILKSEFLGKLREQPQISGRYGIPSSEISVKVSETSVSKTAVRQYNENPRFDFSIEYKRIFDGMRISRSVENSIKWVRVSF